MSAAFFKRAILAVAASALAIVPASGAFAGSTQAPALAPVLGADAANVIPGRYIVVLNNSRTNGAQNRAAAVANAKSMGATIHYEYDAALNGFAATLPDKALEGLRKNPNVAYIEADATVSLEGDLAATQTPVTWGLDRIDQRNLPLSNSFSYNSTASNVRVYVIDTGIRLTHNEFGGRAFTGYDAVTAGGTANDCNGHGTHVAGTIGGATYGVAKGVRLYAVRVLGCNGSGTNSGVIAGINWVTNNHVKPAVANMSLGGGASTAIDSAVNSSISAGVVYAIAAGNSNLNACNYSPARVSAAITVGSTTSTDARSSFSNYGTCLDIFAPGSSITSAWHNSNTATNTISGTSMATPHVAGAAARYLAGSPNASPATVRNALVNAATSNLVTSPGTGSPNKLLYVAP